MFVIKNFGEWLLLPVGSAHTSHVSTLVPKLAIEASILLMFDNDLDTYWMPTEVKFIIPAIIDSIFHDSSYFF